MGIPPLGFALDLHALQESVDPVPFPTLNLSAVRWDILEERDDVHKLFLSVAVAHIVHEGLVDVAIGDFLLDPLDDRLLLEAVKLGESFRVELPMKLCGDDTELDSVVIHDDEVKGGGSAINARSEDWFFIVVLVVECGLKVYNSLSVLLAGQLQSFFQTQPIPFKVLYLTGISIAHSI